MWCCNDSVLSKGSEEIRGRARALRPQPQETFLFIPGLEKGNLLFVGTGVSSEGTRLGLWVWAVYSQCTHDGQTIILRLIIQTSPHRPTHVWKVVLKLCEWSPNSPWLPFWNWDSVYMRKPVSTKLELTTLGSEDFPSNIADGTRAQALASSPNPTKMWVKRLKKKKHIPIRERRAERGSKK